MNILIEDTEPTYHIFDVDMCCLSMIKELPRLIYVDSVKVVERCKKWFPVAIVVHYFFVDREYGIEFLHDEIDVQNGFRGWLKVVH